MKRTLGVLTAAAAALASVGCASVQQPQYDPMADIDTAYVAAVERAAKQFGTQVVWINMPRKKSTN
jgi:hypothetical protein